MTVSHDDQVRAEKYALALSELEREARDLDFEIQRKQTTRKQMEEAIRMLKSRILELTGRSWAVSSSESKAISIGPTTFLGLTVRAAVKVLLHDEGPLTTAEIKSRLEQGGLRPRSPGVDFLSNVSATLSVMMRTHNEVTRVGDKWQLVQEEQAEGDDGPPF